MASKSSPKILSVEWGSIEIEGVDAGKDFKVFPGGARPWDWSETGTRHQPGIQVADVQELLDKGATTVVLSRGMHLKLHVDASTHEFLEGKNITVHVAETREAVNIYNSLAQDGTLVGGLFHSTC
ncbi:hypothetical protein VFPPC_03933 [Pochonia chlamydosporia 170]|uniref:Mth938 domain-containing protein n=1 Tax=Pochonia chlamydosporia 170 TaxID=1380566 RepID=A0A179F2Q1_METCM|nr:hypothetical protein VFPPC_03933 [Pochonia chlamydosporia 170]OAQ59726.1 hypothetical protein VFPPC_03933 [Pochonia chlamydosporia 170]